MLTILDGNLKHAKGHTWFFKILLGALKFEDDRYRAWASRV